MKTNRKRSGACLLNLYILSLTSLVWGNDFAQVTNPGPAASKTTAPAFISQKDTDLFGTKLTFIENIGQYKDTFAGFGRMGKILYGYEGLNMPVLFTKKGIIHLQRAAKKLSHEEMERMERKGLKEKDLERDYTANRIITMEWVNANPAPVVLAEEEGAGYFTYGFLKEKAKTFHRILYKELYPGIDLVYSFAGGKNAGFEYSLVVKPGADISRVKIRYGGDVKYIRQDKDRNLLMSSGIDEISVSEAHCFYADAPLQKFTTAFVVKDHTLSFKTPENYNGQKTLLIDPFVSGTTGLSGSDAGKAKDIDFDYAGNIYVAGGGDGNIQKLSKYNSAGGLEWTFNGSLNLPAWNFGGSHGGWVVEKISGKIYMGQGLAGSGFRVIRLNTEGVYDEYVTAADPAFAENWKMLWNCNGGMPRILIAGGGSTSNIELAYLSPPSTELNALNITGINTGHNDISDIITDPLSNNLFSIFSTSVLNSMADNKIYKHEPPYRVSDMEWVVSPGYFALREPSNRPYLSGLDNSSNTLAANSRYLFYWDGRNLKAFNKNDGSSAGSAVTLPANTLLKQGGIIADECSNVFVGSSNGSIKVFTFNGSTFDDNAAPDINIAGNPTSAVYDLAYDPGKNMMYACGNGFVASYDLSSYCNASTYSLNIHSDCSSLSVSATISPAPPAGSVVLYNLYDGPALVSTNNTGVFIGLTTETNYRIVALINGSCSGSQVSKEFTITGSPLLKINSQTGVCGDNTFDLTAPSVTAGSSTGLSFTYWLDAAATIPDPDPVKTRPGIYYIKATNAGGCSVISSIEIKSLTSPTANAGPDTVVCSGDNNIKLRGSGGPGYLWTPSIYLSDPAIANPVIKYTGNPGIITYRLKVTAANGCESAEDEVKITFEPPVKVFIGNDTVVAFNQPLQMHATDLSNSSLTEFLWSPGYGLNNPFIKDPVAILDKDITYSLQAGNLNHCKGNAEINIRVFRRPEIFVPNSFTPNGDGLNDVLRPTLVGLKEFHYFNVFNRFGQLLFTSTNPMNGWDGKILGKEQNSGTYVWIAEALDYKGNTIQQKGYSTLIR